MKKNTKIIISVVVVLAIIVSIVAAFTKGKGNNAVNNKKNVSETNKKDKSKAASSGDLKNNKNVKSVKKTENGDTITVTIDGKDKGSYTGLKALALSTANELKKENPDKKVVVNVNYKNEQIESVDLGNKSDENKIYFETKPMYDPMLKCIRFKLHNATDVSKVEVYLDDKAIQISDKQILKTKNDVFAVKNIDQDFKVGKIILQDKNGNELNSSF